MIKPEKFIATLKEVVKESPNVKIIKLSNKLDFIPGQFVMFSIDGVNTDKGFPIKKAYSIASEPKKELEFCIKIEDYESFTREQINKWKVGQKFNIYGPFGNFILKDADNLVFIAAGTGIAPFISMLRFSKNKNITLFYSVRDEENLLYKEEIDKYQIKKFITLTKENNKKYLNGRITKELLFKNIKKDSEFYICGPNDFIIKIREYLLDLDIKKANIHVEIWG